TFRGAGGRRGQIQRRHPAPGVGNLGVGDRPRRGDRTEENESMTDDVQNYGTALTTEDHAANADHPHAGIASEGWSSPQADLATPTAQFAKLTLKRSGAETDIEFPVNPPAI